MNLAQVKRQEAMIIIIYTNGDNVKVILLNVEDVTATSPGQNPDPDCVFATRASAP